MNAPARTILDLLGAAPETARLSNATLLIIDAQREYVDGTLPLVGIGEALVAGGTLLRRARAAGTPVVHVLHRGGGPLFDPQGDGFQPAAPLIPQPGESIIEKTQANAFADTGLQDVLVATGRTNLIVIGFMTHNCVSSTVRAAREKGYACTVVAPATATRDLPDGRGGRGGTTPAATVQEACLVGLSDTMAKIVWNAADILD
jgi:nicotinamidase-related amidase